MHSITRPYNCVLCNDEYCTRQELFIHLHNHIDDNTSTNSYNCEKCNLKFSLKENYEQHIKSHFKENNNNINDNEMIINFSCDLCDKTFNFESLLKHHKIIEHEQKRYPCTIGFCDQIFLNENELKIHQNQHDNKKLNKYYCKIEGCERTFEYENHLKRHMSSHILKEYKCDNCNRIYYSESVYHSHINNCLTSHQTLNDGRECDGPVECNLCDQLFENQNVLKNHRNFCYEGCESSRSCSEISQDNFSNLTSIDSNAASPESILSVYVQNDYDSNLLSEL